MKAKRKSSVKSSKSKKLTTRKLKKVQGGFFDIENPGHRDVPRLV